MPESSLLEDVESGNWDSVRANLHDHAYRTRFILRDSIFRTGRTPLHYLCTRKDVPMDVLHKLYQLDKSALHAVDRQGNLALHGACCQAGTSEIVSTLLELESNADGGISMARRLGTHQGVRSCRYTPLQMVWLERIKWSPACWRNIIYLGDVQCASDLTQGDLLDMWQKTKALVWAAESGRISGWRDTSILHAVARCGGLERCPTAAMWLALKLFRNEVGQKNLDGDIPLHVAASSPTHCALECDYFEAPVLAAVYLSQMNEPTIDMLVKSFPMAAKVPNNAGRLPLNLAIESGKSWEEGVRSLLKAAPEALTSRDTLTHLYPFMLAACSKNSSIDTVYKLLRVGPHVIKTDGRNRNNGM